jgi:hypothetical protein
MPAHITHQLFAQRTVKEALSDNGLQLINRFGSWLTLGAQGPDMFLHNQMTEPSSFSYGKLLHTRGYGTFVRCMLDILLDFSLGQRGHQGHQDQRGRSSITSIPNQSQRRHNEHQGEQTSEAKSEGESLLFTPEGAFILAYATHAVLDRHTHPFIMYFSGWVDEKDEATKKYHQCHPFFERILDVLVLESYTKENIQTYDFLSQINVGTELPGTLHSLLADGLTCTFGAGEDRDLLLQKIANGYRDMMDIYTLTNPLKPENLRTAFERDKKENFKNRLLALFHPPVLDNYDNDVDFLNIAGRPWQNPCSEDPKERTESFWALFEAAESAAVPIVKRLAGILEDRNSTKGVEELIGNTNLSDGSSEQPCLPLRCSPLPLPELIEAIYRNAG